MKQKLTDSELISLYFQDKLDPKERHQLERRALDDPFLSDAMEGFDLRNEDALEAEKMLNEEIRRKKHFANNSANFFNSSDSANSFPIIPRKQPENNLAKRAASLVAAPKSNPAPANPNSAPANPILPDGDSNLTPANPKLGPGNPNTVPINPKPTNGKPRKAPFRQLRIAASILLLAISGWYILYLNKTKYNETRSGSAEANLTNRANQANQEKMAKRNVENALPQPSVSQPLAQTPPNPVKAEKRTHLNTVSSKKIPNTNFSQASSPSKISAINKGHFSDSTGLLAASQKQLPTTTASPSASQKLLPITSALPLASPSQFSDSNQFIASNPQNAKRTSEANRSSMFSKSSEVNRSSEANKSVATNRSVQSQLAKSFVLNKAVRENKEDVNKSPIDSSSTSSLNEVVVIGYGTYKNSSSPIIGWEKFNEMLRKNGASPDGHVGIVTVRFYVAQDGKPNGITIIKKLSKSCDRKAMKIIRNGPSWIPS